MFGKLRDFFNQAAAAPPMPVRKAEPRKLRPDAVKVFHAVAVMPGMDACRSAKRVKGHRFLSHQAPALPFGDCDVSVCTCKYRKYADRRQMDDRRSFIAQAHRHEQTGGERRKRSGRRSTDE